MYRYLYRRYFFLQNIGVDIVVTFKVPCAQLSVLPRRKVTEISFATRYSLWCIAASIMKIFFVLSVGLLSAISHYVS